MELRNFFNIDDEKAVSEDCASLIRRCENYMQSHPCSKLWLRDTDHKYNPIRLESENVSLDDEKTLLSLCPKCGLPIHNGFILNRYYEDYGFRFCYYCYALKEEDGWKQTVLLLSYLKRIDSKIDNSIINFIKHKFSHSLSVESSKACGEIRECTNHNKAEKFRIRVLTNRNQLLYLTLNRIRLDINGILYIENGNKKSDKVKFAGVYLKGRDRNGQRLYQGDIVAFDFIRAHNEERVRWKGVLKSIRREHNNKNSFIIEDNLHGNFPPAPEWIINDTIEVIGNIFETPMFNGEESIRWIKFILGDMKFLPFKEYK